MFTGTKGSAEKFPEQSLLDSGYRSIWHGQKSWNGVAILSKDNVLKEIRRALPGDPQDMHSRYIEASVGKIVIGCLYLPNGNPYPGPKFDYKLNWFKRLTSHARKLVAGDVPAILIGDYNVMPTELDVYKPEKYINDALFRKEVRAAYQGLLKQGWIDAIRKLYPNETIYTFWDYLRNAWGRNAGLRLDHFLLSPHLVKKLRGGGVDKHVRGWEKSSDHAPVWIELDI